MKIYIVFFLLLNLLYLAYNLGYVFAFSKRLASGFIHIKYMVIKTFSYLTKQYLFMEDDIQSKRRLKVEHRNEYVTGKNFFAFRTINFFAILSVILDLLLRQREPFEALIVILILLGMFLLQYVIYHFVYIEKEAYKSIFIVAILIQYSLYISYALVLPRLIEYWSLNPFITTYNTILIITSIFNYILITIISMRILFQKTLFNSSKKLGVNILSFVFIWIINILSGAITYDAFSNISTSQLSTIGKGFGFVAEYYNKITEGFGNSYQIITTGASNVDILLAIIPIPNFIILFIFFGRLFDLIVNSDKKQSKQNESVIEFHKTDVKDYHETYFIN
jgi:hypothetical protein